MSKILIVGDVMLDRYWYGEATKLSQEAPVPVLKMQREEYRAGAAANVAMNCKAMGAEVVLVAVVCDDAAGYRLEKILQDHAVDFRFHYSQDIKTTEKLRIIGRHQQMIRVDFESSPPAYGSALGGLRNAFLSTLEESDVVIFSDYGKGALADIQWMIATVRSQGKTILVDPKGHQWEKYKGASVIKPNLDEMRDMCGAWTTEEELERKARQLLISADVAAILLTRAADGMSLFMGTGSTRIPTAAKEVFDVSGAGDTAIAAFGVALTRGMGYAQATRYANRAAGMAVSGFGTVTVRQEDVFGKIL